MSDNKTVRPGDAAQASTKPSIDNSTGQPIEEAEDNLSRHATKDSSPQVAEQGRTTETIDEDRPRSGSQTKVQDDEQARERDL